MAEIAPDPKQLILRAAAHLKAGGCAVMPTETVYGLAACFDSAEGIDAIFRLKKRPSFDPLIVHVADLAQAKDLSAEWSPTAASLAARFWPGPLTLVVPKAPHVSTKITAGLETVGLRMPKHPMALELIRAAGRALAAPSANRFGRTSPTTAAHVRTEFPDAVRRGEIIVLDGGESDVGIESTVCLVHHDEVFVLRPGGVTEDDLRTHFKAEAEKQGRPAVKVSSRIGDHASPGHTEHHYETVKPLIVSWGETLDLTRSFYTVEKVEISTARIHPIELPQEPALAARVLYGALRDGDLRSGYDALFVQRDTREVRNRGGLWDAIDDRLRRAARLQIGR